MKKVHPTAVLKGEVELGEGVEIGPYSIIEGKVKIGRKAFEGKGVKTCHCRELYGGVAFCEDS